jgi:LysR family cyn operon transcriptional activator
LSLDPRRLRYFLAIANERTMARAAESLGLAQPTLSQQMRAMEAELGTVLFDRTSRGMDLTAAGRILQHHAERMLAEEAAALAALRELEGGEAGRVSVGIIHTYNTSVLPPIIEAFSARHPHVMLQVEEATAQGVEQGIVAGRLDLGIAFAPPASPELAHERLFVERLALIVAPSHSMSRRASVSREEIAASTSLALLSTVFATRRLIDAAFAGGPALSVRVEMNSIEALTELVRLGGVATILADKSLIGRSDLVVIPIKPRPIIRTAALMWHVQRYQTGAARALSGIIRAMAGDAQPR